MMIAHPNDRTLQCHLDGELSPELNARVELHLARCAECRDRETRLEVLLRRVGELPATLDPPADLWPAIAARIRETKTVSAVPGADRSRIATRRTGPARRPLAWAVAAAALLALGIGLGRGLPLPAPELALHPSAAAPPPVTFASDPAYDRAVANLQEILAAMSSELRPETIAAIEESLAIIDAAIDDARAALAADPASDYLQRRISIYRQTKLDVLRAATGAAATIEI